MKAISVIGVVLILTGILGLAYRGLMYTDRETVVEAGPVQVEVAKKKRIPLPPILGGVALVAGAALLFIGGRRGN